MEWGIFFIRLSLLSNGTTTYPGFIMNPDIGVAEVAEHEVGSSCLQTYVTGANNGLVRGNIIFFQQVEKFFRDLARKHKVYDFWNETANTAYRDFLG